MITILSTDAGVWTCQTEKPILYYMILYYILSNALHWTHKNISNDYTSRLGLIHDCDHCWSTDVVCKPIIFEWVLPVIFTIL